VCLQFRAQAPGAPQHFKYVSRVPWTGFGGGGVPVYPPRGLSSIRNVWQALLNPATGFLTADLSVPIFHCPVPPMPASSQCSDAPTRRLYAAAPTPARPSLRLSTPTTTITDGVQITANRQTGLLPSPTQKKSNQFSKTNPPSNKPRLQTKTTHYTSEILFYLPASWNATH